MEATRGNAFDAFRRTNYGPCATPVLHMNSENVRQLRHDFGSVLDLIADGQQVEIVKKGKVIALLSPPPPSARPRKFKLPDVAARRKRVFGDRVLPGNIIAEERESYRW